MTPSGGYYGAPRHLTQSPAAATAPARRDAAQADLHDPTSRPSIRREPSPLAAALVPTDDELKLRLAEELEYARRMLEVMGDELSGDTGVVMRHSSALQSIDIVGQMLGHLANVVRSSDPEGAVERIGMCELKSRLKRSKL